MTGVPPRHGVEAPAIVDPSCSAADQPLQSGPAERFHLARMVTPGDSFHDGDDSARLASA